MTDEKDPEALLEQSKQQKRHTSEPTEAETESSVPFDDEVAAAFGLIKAGVVPENITIRDEKLAALFEALDEADRLEELEADAIDHLDRDADADGTKAALARALIRIGLTEISPETISEAKSGYQKHLQDQADEF